MYRIMVGNGASESMAKDMTEMLTAKNEGLDHLVERGSVDVGNSATTFSQWCKENHKPLVKG